ncbi:MAG TPA: prolyl oligopeptidase family serine peptidase [Gemmatimonadaceae bacterium]|jgi:dipeptidyl aminopeptidase/acylaminoacyl peptidase|nr:prolyl oligopeptidase family serine peptidase [Gemmatimonadaceae bacterium]HPV74382.1 prolyl oligopeptidase family serine peptidase [Gemmatimonadaceae bacterium]
MSHSLVRSRSWRLAAAVLTATPSVLFAQQNADATWQPREVLTKETYVAPPSSIARLVSAPRQNQAPLTDLSPDRRYFLRTITDGLPSVQVFGKPHYYFAGLQVDYQANRARSLTNRGATSLALVEATTGKVTTIEAPKGATIASPAWSPDGSRIAYLADFDNATKLYVADVATGKSRPLGAGSLLATLVTAPEWSGDGSKVFTVLLPDGRKPEPKRPAIETGPLVRITDGDKNKTRTYASLLRDAFERELMEYYVTGQLAAVDARSGAVSKIGAPAMIAAIDPSPDGKYVRVTRMDAPFSYIVQYTNFAQREELWDVAGKVVTTLVVRPLREGDTPVADGPVASQAADTARRNFAWLPNGGGLTFLKQDPAPARGAGADTAEAPRGPGANGARRKDKLFTWAAPFATGTEKVVHESDTRMSGVLFTDDAKVAFVAENATGTGHVYAVYFDEPGKRYTLWRLRGITASVGRRGGFFGGGGRGGAGDDSLTFYQNPGNLMVRRGKMGVDVAMLSSDGTHAYLEGTRYFKDWQTQAPRGFVDKVEIKSAKKTRLFEGAADTFDNVVAALDDDFSKAVLTRESPSMVPNTFVREMASGTLTPVTNNADLTPEFTNAVRKRVEVTRADGIKFIVNVTLPAGYVAGTRLPGMLWLYPYEYTDQAGYDRTLRTENINRFPQAGPRTIEYLVTQGYAVANFSPPVIGSAGRMNDNYVTDLQKNLSAVIDELDRQQFIDRTKLAIGGHSYGAFTTVNALVHTPYFKAGIAGDGMYNRTLTPSGFQSERRDFWEGQETYLEMSPFFKADQLTGALLMYHSIEDQNVGTAPISSERLMHALEGLGKTASLYMYPYEDHGPATKETLLDQWARWTAWLDVYVKQGEKKPVKAQKPIS